MSAATVAPAAAAGRWLAEVGALTGRRLRHLRRAPARVLGVALSPLVSLFLLGYLFRGALTIPSGGSYAEYLFAGAAVQVALAGLGPTAIAVAVDLRSGAIDRFRSLPIGRATVLVGHVAADLLIGLLALAVVAGVGLALGWRSHTGPVPTLAGFGLVAAFIVVMLWVGVLFAVCMRTIESISAVTPFLVIVLPFLSNAFVDPRSVPGPLRALVSWNPLSALVTACRQLWGNPAATDTGWAGQHPVPVLAGTLAVLLVVSVAVSLRRFGNRGAA